MPRPFAIPVTVSDVDRVILLGCTRRQKTAQALALRARIVLAAESSVLGEKPVTNTAIAERLGITMITVAEWRRRVAERGLDGLHDTPRPGAARTITKCRHLQTSSR